MGTEDAFRHLSKTDYLCFFENGRIAYFEELHFWCLWKLPELDRPQLCHQWTMIDSVSSAKTTEP